MAGTSKLWKPCRECTMSFPLLFSTSTLIVSHSQVLCISELTSFYQTPAPCGISQPAGHRHVVPTQPRPASPESRRTNPGSFPPRCLKGAGWIACYREDCENKPLKHGSDVGIYTGAAPLCLIPFNRGSKEVMWNGNCFFIYIFIPFSVPKRSQLWDYITSRHIWTRGPVKHKVLHHKFNCLCWRARSQWSFTCWPWRSSW